jgi:hypothetical protein
MIASFVIGVHPIVLDTAAPVIVGAPKIVSAVHGNFVFFLSQAPSCNGVRISL